jgi:zinc D-Ala-D-Ala carboxypeptidase
MENHKDTKDTKNFNLIFVLFVSLWFFLLPIISPVNSSTTGPNLTLAAVENARLKTELDWAFGGKPQRGWYLYIPLISHTIGTDKNIDSADFALALSRWQKSAKLAPSGILDEITWTTMMRAWQSRLSKGRVRTIPDNLFVGPPADFYDPGRAEELRKVEPQTYAAYKRMVTAALADPSLKLAKKRNGELAPSEKYLKIVSAYRPQEYQDSLIKKYPNATPVTLAKISPHLTGRALDLYVGGEPTSTKDNNRAIQIETQVYKWLVKNAEKFNFYPYFYEPWHWEYLP